MGRILGQSLVFKNVRGHRISRIKLAGEDTLDIGGLVARKRTAALRIKA